MPWCSFEEAEELEVLRAVVRGQAEEIVALERDLGQAVAALGERWSRRMRARGELRSVCFPVPGGDGGAG